MKYRYATRPRPHQKVALKRLIRQRGGGLQVPMRWGKTKLAIDWANVMHLMYGAQRVLVVCPATVLGVWELEIPKHTPDGINLDWRVINFERVYARSYVRGRSWYPVENPELIEFNPDIIIVDESHNIGNPNAVTSRMLYQLGRRARFRLIMTGTMFHRKPFFVFGQVKFYDPSIFGGSFESFRKRIAVFGGYGGYEVIRYQNLKWMMRKVKTFVHIEKYVPPGEPVVNVLKFHLTGRGLATYAEMEKESIIEVAGHRVTSPIVLSRHLRLQQIAGGWVRTEAGTYVRVGDDLARIGAERLQMYADEGIRKVVIGCRFIPELVDAARAAKAAGYDVLTLHGGVPKGHERTRRQAQFNATRRRCVIVCQVQTASQGIDLSAADTMLMWGLSESYVTHDQFTRRIERYQDDRTLVYDYLVPTGTRTEVTYQALSMKQDVATFIVDHPDVVESITSKEDR